MSGRRPRGRQGLTVKRPIHKLVAIDPGGAHVGWCEGLWDGRELMVVDVWEFDPEAAMQRAELVFPHTDTVIIESFRLYPDKAKLLIGSEMETSQMIGALKYLSRHHRCNLVMQPAAIKAPTLSVLKHRGVKLEAVRLKRGGHAKDAETHLHHYVVRTLKES